MRRGGADPTNNALKLFAFFTLMEKHYFSNNFVCIYACNVMMFFSYSLSCLCIIFIHIPMYLEPLERYVGHTALVSSIIYQNDSLVSVSWDR